MVSSRQAIACILLSLGLVAYAQAQSSAPKEQTASISGKVTLKNKAVSGIVVVAMPTNYGGGSQRGRHRSTTDDEGNYRITDIPAGTYNAFPLAPALAVEKAQATRMLTIAAGESIRDVNFAMVRGGVITGLITNADGQPLVEESVHVMPVDSPPDFMPFNFNIHTDDRGIYRAFGLRQGKYRVSAGQPKRNFPGVPQHAYSQTFYPSVTNINKATPIEVTEGSEVKDIDIVVAGSLSTFTVSGRVVDGTGKPVPGIFLSVQQSDGNSSMSTSAGRTNSNGEFKVQNVMPGQYKLYIAPSDDSDLRSDPLPIEVIDHDLKDLEIKTKRGASLSGMVVLENSSEKSIAAKLKGLRIFAWMERPSSDFEGASRSADVGADGSFKISGLSAGNARLSFVSINGSDVRQFEILQVERNGVPQPSIRIEDGEQIDGVRMIVKHLNLTGTIRGQVKIENGELLPGSRIVVWFNHADQNLRTHGTSLPAAEVDSRNRFLLERLAAGTYELSAGVFEQNRRVVPEGARQVVTVTDNAVTEVTLTIRLKP